MPGVEFGFGVMPREELEAAGSPEGEMLQSGETLDVAEGVLESPEGVPVQGTVSELQGQADVEGRLTDVLENVESRMVEPLQAPETVTLENAEQGERGAERTREEYREMGVVALAATEVALTELSKDQTAGVVQEEVAEVVEPGAGTDLEPADVAGMTAEMVEGGEAVGAAAGFELDMLSPGEATDVLMMTAAVERVEERMEQDRGLAEQMYEASAKALEKFAKAEGAEKVAPEVPKEVEPKVAEVNVSKVEAPKVEVVAETPEVAQAEVKGVEPKDDFAAYIESVLNAA